MRTSLSIRGCSGIKVKEPHHPRAESEKVSALGSFMKKFYVYIYRDSETPFYVGKGTGNRAFKHLTDKRGSHFTNRIQKLLRDGRPPDIEIIDALDEDHAKFLEVCLIEVFGRADLNRGPLLNLTDGGDGRTTWSEEQKKSHSEKMTGQRRTEETKQTMRLSAATRKKPTRVIRPNAKKAGRKPGCIVSEEHRQRLATAQSGKKQSQETKAKISETRKKTNAARKLLSQT